MEHLFSMDATLAMEVEITRSVLDNLFSRVRRTQVQALYAAHAHENAVKTWDNYIKAVCRID